MVNPRNKPITPNIIGLFLTTSSDAAKRAWFYCRVCHENIEKIEEKFGAFSPEILRSNMCAFGLNSHMPL